MLILWQVLQHPECRMCQIETGKNGWLHSCKLDLLLEDCLQLQSWLKHICIIIVHSLLPKVLDTILLASVHGHIRKKLELESLIKQVRTVWLVSFQHNDNVLKPISNTMNWIQFLTRWPETMHTYNTTLYCMLMLYSSTTTIISMLRCCTAVDLVMVGLVCKAYSDGCRNTYTVHG